MSLDQKIQIWNAIGTWAAGFSTLLAVIVSLCIAYSSNRIRTKTSATSMIKVIGDGTPFIPFAGIQIINLGQRRITVTGIGWSIGKGKLKRYAVQPLDDQLSSRLPTHLEYGEKAIYCIFFENWIEPFSKDYVRSKSELKSLRALIYLSIDKTIEIKPNDGLLDDISQRCIK